jgi:hypothetical protein
MTDITKAVSQHFQVASSLFGAHKFRNCTAVHLVSAFALSVNDFPIFSRVLGNSDYAPMVGTILSKYNDMHSVDYNILKIAICLFDADLLNETILNETMRLLVLNRHFDELKSAIIVIHVISIHHHNEPFPPYPLLTISKF